MTELPSTPTPVWRLHLSRTGTARPVVAPQHRALAGLAVPVADPICQVRLHGPVDTDRLRAACRQVLAAHPVTRQRLTDTPAGHRLIISDLVVEGSGGEPDKRTELDDTDVSVVKLLADGNDHVLRWHLAAASADPTGMLRTVTAVGAAYRGIPSACGPSPHTVDTFLDAVLTDATASTARRRWRADVSDSDTALLARSMRLRPTPYGPRTHVPVPLSSTASAGIVALAATLQVSPEAVLFTAWRLLLHRIAGTSHDNLAVFCPGAVHQLTDTVGLLGRYVPLPLTAYGEHLTVGDQLTEVERSEESGRCLADAVIAADRELSQARELADFYAPDCNADHAAGFRYTPTATPDFGPGVHARIEVLQAPIDAIRIELQVLQFDDDRIEPTIDADTAGTAPDLLRRLAEWLTELLTKLPHQQRTNLREVVDEALYSVLAAGQVRGANRPTGSTVLASFAEQTMRTPDACAARDDGTALSYRCLYEHTAAVSLALHSHGVGLGDRVAVCMRRGVPLLTTILAVMHRGAAFVPLDPALPGDRLAVLLADAEPQLVVVDTVGVQALPASAAQPVIPIDDLLAVPDGEQVAAARQYVDANSDGRSIGCATSADTAYMIYTSGSTGQPKGVPITHGALINYLSWASQEYTTSAGTGTIVHSSISADLTITSLLLPLLTGQSVTLLASDDPQDLAAALRGLRGLSPLKLTPGGLRLLCELLPGHVLTNAARHLVLGGEQLTAAAWAGLQAHGLPITNEYGPTEATVGCCAYTFRLGDPVPDPVPIGQPIWNTTIEIRAADGRIALPGTAGELIVAGAGLARGYHRRDDETTDRFLPGPRYRTGDLAVLEKSGTARMLGRIDDQVKVHGYRIEPGEVENVLTEQPGIVAAAVVAVGTPPVLHAFLVPEHPDAAGDLIGHAERYSATRLPFYARPGRYYLISELPLKRNGKRDRDALLALAGKSQMAVAGVAAHDVAEPGTHTSVTGKVIAALWRDVLGSEPEGPDADFFAAGADSIKAVLLAAHAQQTGLSLTVRDILEARTLRRIVATTSPSSGRAAVTPSGPVPLTAHQRGFFDRHPRHPNRWTLRWIADAPDDTDLVRISRALRRVLAEHPALRTQFRIDDGQWTAHIADDNDTIAHLVDLTGSGLGDDPIGDALDRCGATIDLNCRVVHLCLLSGPAPARTRIAWTVHHLVCDVVSLHLLTARLWYHYREPHSPADRTPSATDDGYGAMLRHETHRPATVFPALTAVTTLTRPGQVPADLGRHLNWPPHATAHGPLAALSATLIRTLAEVRPDLPTLMCVERHGRDHGTLNLAATIGWLTEFRTLTARRDILGTQALLTDLHTQLDAAAHRGASAPRTVATASAVALPAVALNYLGELPADAVLAIEQTSEAQPLFGIELVCWICRDTLHLRWRYPNTFLAEATAGQLTSVFARHAAKILPERPADQHAPATATRGVSSADLQRIAALFEGGRA